MSYQKSNIELKDWTLFSSFKDDYNYKKFQNGLYENEPLTYLSGTDKQNNDKLFTKLKFNGITSDIRYFNNYFIIRNNGITYTLNYVDRKQFNKSNKRDIYDIYNIKFDNKRFKGTIITDNEIKKINGEMTENIEKVSFMDEYGNVYKIQKDKTFKQLVDIYYDEVCPKFKEVLKQIKDVEIVKLIKLYENQVKEIKDKFHEKTDKSKHLKKYKFVLKELSYPKYNKDNFNLFKDELEEAYYNYISTKRTLNGIVRPVYDKMLEEFIEVYISKRLESNKKEMEEIYSESYKTLAKGYAELRKDLNKEIRDKHMNYMFEFKQKKDIRERIRISEETLKINNKVLFNKVVRELVDNYENILKSLKTLEPIKYSMENPGKWIVEFNTKEERDQKLKVLLSYSPKIRETLVFNPPLEN